MDIMRFIPPIQAPPGLSQVDLQETPQPDSMQARRLLYLLDFLANIPTMGMVLPILKMGIAAMPSQKLNSLLLSLSEIEQAVCDSDSSQDEFDDKIEPHIRTLMAVFANDTN